MRAFVEKVMKYYQRGIYRKTHIDAMLASDKITEREHEYILGGRA